MNLLDSNQSLELAASVLVAHERPVGRRVARGEGLQEEADSAGCQPPEARLSAQYKNKEEDVRARMMRESADLSHRRNNELPGRDASADGGAERRGG